MTRSIADADGVVFTNAGAVGAPSSIAAIGISYRYLRLSLERSAAIAKSRTPLRRSPEPLLAAAHLLVSSPEYASDRLERPSHLWTGLNSREVVPRRATGAGAPALRA